MPRYPVVLLDADNTLFDFDAAEYKALRAVLRDRGYSTGQDTVDVYLSINTALWDAFNRGEVEQDFLLVERFRRFEQAMGGDHDPAAFNADYLAALASNNDLIPGALELCRSLAGLGCTLAIVTNGTAVAQRGRYSASPIRDYIPHLFISQEIGARKPDSVFLTMYVESWIFLTGAALWWWETTSVPTFWAETGRESTQFGTTLTQRP